MKENKMKVEPVEEFENIAGYGIIGRVQNEKIILGNSKIVSKYNIKNDYIEDEKELDSNGNSIIYVIKNERIISIIGVNDVIRENAKEVIKKLHQKNIKTIMLTGDNKQTAEKVAEKLEISRVVSNVLPSEKADLIKKLKKENKYVMMCGDGINDSPALANSDIGVSVKSGTDIAMDSSDVILTKNDLNSILKLINISERTIRNIRQNLFWAFFYNSLMIPIAMGVFRFARITINPDVASFAMVFSSITVIFNALRLRKK